MVRLVARNGAKVRIPTGKRVDNPVCTIPSRSFTREHGHFAVVHLDAVHKHAIHNELRVVGPDRRIEHGHVSLFARHGGDFRRPSLEGVSIAFSRGSNRNLVAGRDCPPLPVIFRYGTRTVRKANPVPVADGVKYRRIHRGLGHGNNFRGPSGKRVVEAVVRRLRRSFTLISGNTIVRPFLTLFNLANLEYHRVGVDCIQRQNGHLGFDNPVALVPTGKGIAFARRNFGSHFGHRHARRSYDCMILANEFPGFGIPNIVDECHQINIVAFRSNSRTIRDERQILVYPLLAGPHVIRLLPTVQFARKLIHHHIGSQERAIFTCREGFRFAIAYVVRNGPTRHAVFPAGGYIRFAVENLAKSVNVIHSRVVVVRDELACKSTRHFGTAGDIAHEHVRIGRSRRFHADIAHAKGILHGQTEIALDKAEKATHKEALAAKVFVDDRDIPGNGGLQDFGNLGAVTANSAYVCFGFSPAHAIALESDVCSHRSRIERDRAQLRHEATQDTAHVDFVRAICSNKASVKARILESESLVATENVRLADNAAHEYVFGARLNGRFNFHGRRHVVNCVGTRSKAGGTSHTAQEHFGFQIRNGGGTGSDSNRTLTRRAHDRHEGIVVVVGDTNRGAFRGGTKQTARIVVVRNVGRQGIGNVDRGRAILNLEQVPESVTIARNIIERGTANETAGIYVIRHALHNADLANDRIADCKVPYSTERHVRHFAKKPAHRAATRNRRVTGATIRSGRLKVQSIVERSKVLVLVGHYARKATQGRRGIHAAVVTDLATNTDVVQGVLHGHTHDTAQEHRVF